MSSIEIGLAAGLAVAVLLGITAATALVVKIKSRPHLNNEFMLPTVENVVEVS